MVGLVESGAGVADQDGNKFNFPSYVFEGCDMWGVLDGLLLELAVASKVLSESDVD